MHLLLQFFVVFVNCRTMSFILTLWYQQGSITCGAIDEPRKSSKAIDKRVIIDFCDKNAVIASFRNKIMFLTFFVKFHDMS